MDLPATRPAFPEESYDVVIIGGGPAGQSAALILARARRHVVVVDAGQPRNAAARQFHGYLGRDGDDPKALLRDGRQELAKYGVAIFDDRVIDVECGETTGGQFTGTGFRAMTASGRTLTGRKLLFATGVKDELPDLPGVEECYGASIHHCPYCDGWEHRDERLVAFGKDAESAIGLGLSLKTWSDQVTVLTNGETATDEQRQKLAANGIDLVEERVLGIVHEGDRMTGVRLQGGTVVPADAMFFNTSQRPASHLPQRLGCVMKDHRAVLAEEKQHTSVPGAFAAGDADDDVQFVIVAAAEGAKAATAINRELQEEDRAAVQADLSLRR
ncbi:MAG TPA: NAD(P)/FAD-dependent oxidoreductase [Pirellulaceae bacterium]|jgi:thioredoxin reductase|nr:NAD(P)/FAD-dependent oxidoreductase [Pirellulaceae bacterium]